MREGFVRRDWGRGIGVVCCTLWLIVARRRLGERRSAVVRCGIPHFCFRFYVSEGPHRCVLVDASALGPGMRCCACLLGMISGELDFRASRNFECCDYSGQVSSLFSMSELFSLDVEI